ncbi:MAG: S41 family peptidase [Bacteroidia bacterium]|jgi:carboxyl-terminal processing protease|nr:S41 family peptidase [Bacteroidia bacterium]
MPFFKKIRLFSLILLFALSLGLLYSFSRDYFEISKNLDIFNAIYRELNMSYVDDTRPGKLMKTGIDAMLNSLDPYTVYFTEDDIEEYKFITTGEYGGIGASVIEIKGKYYVDEPREGFAAFKAGIRAGDRILSINGNSLEGKNYDAISKLLRGNAGTPVRLKLLKPNATAPVDVNLTREEIKSPAVPYSTLLPDGKTGIIKLTSFTENCSGEVKAALLDLKSKGCTRLILDLRGNPGGLLHEAVNIVNLFVEKGQEVVYTKGRVTEWDRSYLAVHNPVDLHIPLVVMVDENSASASEIVSGALQDLDRAIVMGKRTYGKGLVQQTRDLVYNAKVKITVAKYYIPSGRCVQALDYSHKDASGRVEKVPDSLVTAFKTKGGRIVYDGAGISPDVPVKETPLQEGIANLQSKYFIFNYATLYSAGHSSLRDSTRFEMNHQEFLDFLKYLQTEGFSYQTTLEAEMEDIKKKATENNSFESIQNEYTVFMEKLKQDKSNEFENSEKQICQALSQEIISRYYFQKGRLIHAMRNDAEVTQAINMLQNEAEFKALLGRVEKPNKPFNASKKF